MPLGYLQRQRVICEYRNFCEERRGILELSRTEKLVQLYLASQLDFNQVCGLEMTISPSLDTVINHQNCLSVVLHHSSNTYQFYLVQWEEDGVCRNFRCHIKGAHGVTGVARMKHTNTSGQKHQTYRIRDIGEFNIHLVSMPFCLLVLKACLILNRMQTPSYRSFFFTVSFKVELLFSCFM